MKKSYYLISFILLGTLLFACTSSSNKSGTSSEDLAKADTIPFFTTLKKMHDLKDTIAKEFGSDVKFLFAEFSDSSLAIDVLNKNGDSIRLYTHKDRYGGKRFAAEDESEVFDSTYKNEVLVLDDLNFTAIPAILKNFKDKNKCEVDTCVLSAINIVKEKNPESNNIEVAYKITVYNRIGETTISKIKLIADKNGNIYDWGEATY